MLNLTVINESTVTSDAEVQKMLPAFDTQWNTDLKSAWGVDDAKFKWVPRGRHPEPARGGWCFWMTAIRPVRWPIMI
jgi:hypothetical protein